MKPKKLEFLNIAAGRGANSVADHVLGHVGRVEVVDPKPDAVARLTDRYGAAGASTVGRVGRGERDTAWLRQELPLVVAADDPGAIASAVRSRDVSAPTYVQGVLRDATPEGSDAPWGIRAAGNGRDRDAIADVFGHLARLAPLQSSAQLRTSGLARHRLSATRTLTSRQTARDLLEPARVLDRERPVELLDASGESYPLVLRREALAPARMQELAFDTARANAAVMFEGEEEVNLVVVGVTRGVHRLAGWLRLVRPRPSRAASLVQLVLGGAGGTFGAAATAAAFTD